MEKALCHFPHLKGNAYSRQTGREGQKTRISRASDASTIKNDNIFEFDSGVNFSVMSFHGSLFSEMDSDNRIKTFQMFLSECNIINYNSPSRLSIKSLFNLQTHDYISIAFFTSRTAISTPSLR